MSAGFYRGTTHDQTPYFADKQKKELDETTWPVHFDEPLDLERVHLQVVRPWIGQKVRSLLGYEDDIVTLYCVQLLEKTGVEDGDRVCPKKMTVSLRGFLPEGKALKYVSDLWSLLLQAQSSKHGVPQELVDCKLRDVEEMQTRPQADDSRDHITHPTRSRRFRSRSPAKRSRSPAKRSGRRTYRGERRFSTSTERSPCRSSSEEEPRYRRKRRESRSPPRRRSLRSPRPSRSPRRRHRRPRSPEKRPVSKSPPRPLEDIGKLRQMARRVLLNKN
ncbi:MAG: hypothetical protein KVP17_000029 [Porospora cf. gigantea B]|uniref:uncharacterized protein n=1 Tax=Porospora cf. gigantea B TaxID=2853592 RepID=UPI003571C5DB|nr:MAG: hypothetical protein KVP17_000029 [Porospora cf. gigantea B]